MKLKDYVTLGNLLCGFAAVIALFRDRFDWACYLVFIAYLFDVLDGPVARLTRQHDKFGGLLDEISDYITNSIVVSFIVFYAFWRNVGYHWGLAAAIGACPFVFGTIRQAKSMEHNLSYPCYWLGLPRPVLGLFALALINSSVFTITSSPWRELAHAGGAALIVVGSLLHLTKIPFINHHQRRWMGPLRVGMLWFLVGLPLALIVAWLGRTAFCFDWMLFSFVCYVFLSWTQIPKTDLQRIRTYVAGGALVTPLVHRDSAWRSRSVADYWFDRTGEEPGAPVAPDAPALHATAGTQPAATSAD